MLGKQQIGMLMIYGAMCFNHSLNKFAYLEQVCSKTYMMCQESLGGFSLIWENDSHNKPRYVC